MSPSLQEVKFVSVQSSPDAPADVLGGHLQARSTQRLVLWCCSLVGLIGVTILVAIIAGHPPDTTVAALQN